MNSQSHETIIKRAISWWNDRRQAMTDLNEIQALGAQGVADLAAECGVSPSQLISVVKAGPHASDEMPELMQALGIDPDVAQAHDHRMFNDMQAVCAICGHKGECRRDLANGEAGAHYHDYCANADTLDSLRATLN